MPITFILPYAGMSGGVRVAAVSNHQWREMSERMAGQFSRERAAERIEGFLHDAASAQLHPWPLSRSLERASA